MNVYNDHNQSINRSEWKEVIWLDLFTLYYVVTLAIELITGCFIKFRENGKLPRLGSKFRGPRKTVGPIHVCTQYVMPAHLTISMNLIRITAKMNFNHDNIALVVHKTSVDWHYHSLCKEKQWNLSSKSKGIGCRWLTIQAEWSCTDVVINL